LRAPCAPLRCTSMRSSTPCAAEPGPNSPPVGAGDFGSPSPAEELPPPPYRDRQGVPVARQMPPQD